MRKSSRKPVGGERQGNDCSGGVCGDRSGGRAVMPVARKVLGAQGNQARTD